MGKHRGVEYQRAVAQYHKLLRTALRETEARLSVLETMRKYFEHHMPPSRHAEYSVLKTMRISLLEKLRGL